MEKEVGKTKNLKFDRSDKKCVRSLKFLEESCGRKKAMIVAIAINELMDKYGLEGKTVKEMHQFIKSYDFLQGMSMNSSIKLSLVDGNTGNKEVDLYSKEDDVTEKEELQELAALFT